MCFYTIKVIILHTWFQFLKSSNTQKEDLGGTQVGNDHVSRTRIKKISITFLRIIPINYLSWKVREPKLGLEQETWFDAGFEAGSFNCDNSKGKVLEFALNLHTILPIDNLATSQGRNWAQVELLLVTGQGF